MAIEKDDTFRKVRFILDHYDGISNGPYRFLFIDFLDSYNKILALVKRSEDFEGSGLIFFRNMPKFRPVKIYTSMNLRKFFIEVILDGDLIAIDMDKNRKEILDACKNYIRFVKNFK